MGVILIMPDVPTEHAADRLADIEANDRVMRGAIGNALISQVVKSRTRISNTESHTLFRI